MLLRGEEIFFLERYEHPELSIVYVPLRSFLAVCKKELIEIIKEDNSKVADDFFKTLYRKTLINPYDIHKISTNIAPQLSIPITDNCNLKCQYCYFRAGDDDKRATQSKEEIKSCVDAYIKALEKYPIHKKENCIDISIAGGGEPTTSFDQLKYTVLYCEQAFNKIGVIPHFSMPTNGVYGDEVRSFIVSHFTQISLSMDGPKHIQDLHRPMKNGKSSYVAVFDTAKYFYKAGLPYAFRATISNYSVNYMKEILDFFNTEFPGKTVGFEPLNLFGRAIGNEMIAPPNDDLYSEKLLEAYDYAYSHGISIRTAGTGKFDQLRTVFCGAVGIPNWTITTDGRITSCTRDNLPEVFSFGTYDRNNKSLIIEEEKINKIRQFNVFNYPECTDCFCKYNCAGDCPDLRISNMLNCNATRKVATYVFNKKCDDLPKQ